MAFDLEQEIKKEHCLLALLDVVAWELNFPEMTENNDVVMTYTEVRNNPAIMEAARRFDARKSN